MNISYPFHISNAGRVSSVDDVVRQWIEQILLTEPGQRVNLPSFGCGLKRLVFEGINDTTVSHAKFLINSNLAKWLSDYIIVDDVSITSTNNSIYIKITYTKKYSGESDTMSLPL